MKQSGQKDISAVAGARARAEDVRTTALLAVGLGCLCGFARMYSLGFVGYLAYEVVSSVDQWEILRAFTQIAALIALALNGRYGWLKLGLGSLAAASVFAIASAILFAIDSTGALGPAAALLGGVGVAVLAYVWTLLLSSFGVKTIVVASVSALVLTALIVEGAPLVGPELGLIVATLAAFTSGAAAVRLDPDLESCAPDGSIGTAELLRIPWLTVAMMVACGFLVTVLFGVAQRMTWLYDWQANYAVVFAAVIAVIGATAALMLRSRSWMHVAWVPLFALFALAIVFSCLTARATIQIAVSCMMAAMFCATCLYWMVFPALFSTLRIPRAFLAGVALLFMNSALASLVGDVLGAALPRSMQGLGSVSGLMAILLAVLFAAVFVMNRNRFGAVGMLATDSRPRSADQQESIEASEDSALGNVHSEGEKADDVSNPTDVLKEHLEDYVEQFGLTPRESEVALYTVQGFSCAYIADKLVVSNSTVRFHQQNIYRKFEVHSRNELIEFVSTEGAREEDAS